MSTGYPSSWPHPTTQVIGDTIRTRTHPTAKPGHTLARPGHWLVSLRRFSDFHRHERDNSTQCIPQRIFGTIKLVSHLQVHPESRGRTKVAGETHCSVRRDSPLPMNDFIDTTRRNTDSDGKLVLRNSEALNEVLHEDFARVNRSDFSGSQRSQPLLDQRRPPEADTPLIIDSNTVLPRTITAQTLEPVARRDPEVFQTTHGVNPTQLAQRDAEGSEATPPHLRGSQHSAVHVRARAPISATRRRRMTRE